MKRGEQNESDRRGFLRAFPLRSVRLFYPLWYMEFEARPRGLAGEMRVVRRCRGIPLRLLCAYQHHQNFGVIKPAASFLLTLVLYP